MPPSRKPPSAAFWATVVVAMLLVAYPLSFGPACWFASSVNWFGMRRVSSLYWPMGWVAVHGPTWIGRPIVRYSTLFGDGNTLVIPYGSDGHGFVADGFPSQPLP